MTDPVTVQPTRDQLRALANAATPGPWEYEWDEDEGEITVRAGTARVDEDGFAPGSYVTTDMILEREDAWPEDSGEQHAADAEFIAAARTAVPRLIDQLDAAEQRIRDLTQEVRDERGAARDQMEQVRIRDARIRHLEDTARVLVKEALNAEAERDSARGYISELETAVQSRNDVIKHRDARIQAVRDLCDAEEDPDQWPPRPVMHGGEPFPATLYVGDIRRALEGDA